MGYPEAADVFTNLDATSYIASSDPNAIADCLENTQGFVGSMGKPQSWSTTLLACLRRYRRGMEVVVKSDNKPYVRAGEAMLEDTNSAKRIMRANTTDIEITTSHLDVGTMAVTYYFVYAKGGAAATTAPIVISTDPVAPSASAIGTIPFVRLGWFYNAIAAAVAVTWCGNEKIGSCDVPNMAQVHGSTNLGDPATFATVPDCWMEFYSFGRPVKLYFQMNNYGAASMQAQFEVDGTALTPSRQSVYTGAGGQDIELSISYVANLVSGPHRIGVQWQGNGGTMSGGTYPPLLIAEEV